MPPRAAGSRQEEAAAARNCDAMRTPRPRRAPPRTFASRLGRDFLLLWTGQSASEFGAQVGAFALPLTAVLLLHADAWQMGVLAALTTLPFVLVGPLVGVWADRARRRPLLVAADVGRTALLAAVPALALAHRLNLAALDAIAFATGCLTALFDIAYQAYVPALVGRDALSQANARLEASRALSQVAGPGLGGVLVSALTAPVTVAASALTYAGSALTLGAIRHPEPPPRPDPGSLWREVWTGLAWVVRHPLLAPLAGCTATANLFEHVGLALYPLYALHRVGLTPSLLGGVYAASSLGGLAGALAVGRVERRLGTGRALLLSILASGAFRLLIPLAPDRKGAGAALLAVAAAGIGFGSTLYNVVQVTLRQRLTPDALLGRMTASMRLFVWGTIPLGSLLGGLVATHLGLRPTLWLSAVGDLTAVAWIAASPLSAAGRKGAADAARAGAS
jgi:predicted MFS family arabinose efflux permease